MLKAAVITICIVVSVWYLAGCKAAGKDTRWRERQWIKKRKKEEKEPWKYCDDQCIWCEFKKRCERSEAKEVGKI